MAASTRNCHTAVTLLLLILTAVEVTAQKICIDKPGSVQGSLVFPVDNITASMQTCFQDIRYCTSTKFSICLQLQPAKIDSNGCNTVFTTGGDTPYAYGSYLLYLGSKAFVFGVYGTDSTGASVRWEAQFSISQSSLPVTVCGTWEDRSGLVLYVDDMRAIIKQNGVAKYMDRFFLTSLIPFQETMIFCKEKTGIAPDNSGISNVCVEQTVWDSDTLKANPLAYADLGCTASSNVPAKYVVSSNLITSTQDKYKADCFENCGYFRPNPSSIVDMKQVFGIQKGSPNFGQCMCIGMLSSLTDISILNCDSAPDLVYHLYLTSQLYLPPNVYTYFTTDVSNPYAADMFTGDSIAFNLKIYMYSIGSAPVIMSSTDYTVTVDFGDGTTAVLKQSVFSHAYSSSGQNTVKISVSSVYGDNSTQLTLTIKNKETEETVDIDVVKIFPAQSGTSKSIAYTAVIAGRSTKTAIISVNDEAKTNFQVASYSLVQTGTVTVDTFGFFNVTLCVSNNKVTKCFSAIVLVGDPSSRLVLCTGTGASDLVTTNFPIMSSVKSKLQVVNQPGNTVVAHTADSNVLTVTCSSLAAIGPQDLQLFVMYDTYMMALALRVGIQTCPTLNIQPTKLSGLQNDTFPVTFHVNGVGRYDLQICDGLHSCEYLVVDGLNGELLIQRNFLYGATGLFAVTLQASNSGCAKETQVMLGTQVPITDAYMIVRPLKSLKTDLVIDLYINTHFGLAIGGESNTVQVSLPGMTPKTFPLSGDFTNFGPFTLTYSVTSYGPMRVTMALQNQISSLTITNSTTIGEPIENPAVQLIQPVGGVNRFVVFALTVSKGFPVTFQLNGNTAAGATVTQTLANFNPNDYADSAVVYLWRTKGAGSNATMSPTGSITYIATASSSAPSTTVEAVGTMTVSNSGRLFLFSLYGYNFQVGPNTVTLRASNVFSGGVALGMCGSIINSLSSDSCTQQVEYRTSGLVMAFSTKIRLEMSAALTITASYSSTCSISSYYFSWQVFKVLDSSAPLDDPMNLAPLSYQCSSVQSASFVLDKYTLSYGLYQVGVFSSPTNYPANLSPRQFFSVEVVRSSLACQFHGDRDRAVNLGDVLDIDYSNCRDPDDFIGNNTVRVVAACVGESSKSAYATVDCCSQKFETSQWNQMTLYANSTTPSPNATDFKLYDKKGQGSCFTNPSLLSYKEAEKTVYAETEALNSNDMMKVCICAFDKMGRQATDIMQVKVLVIQNINDAQSVLSGLDPTNPVRALSVINMVSSTIKGTNDTSLVQAVKESACAKVDQVSQYLTDVTQANTLSVTLASITSGGVSVNTQLSSSSALSNTANTLTSFISANLDQVVSVTGGAAATVANIQSTLTPVQEGIVECLATMEALGFDTKHNLDQCGAAAEEEMTVARHRRSVREAPDDPSKHKGDPVLLSSSCPLPPNETLPDHVFYCVKTCKDLMKLLLYDAPEDRQAKCDKRYKDLLERQEAQRITKSTISDRSLGSLKSCAGTTLSKGSSSDVTANGVSVSSFRMSNRSSNASSNDGGNGAVTEDGGVILPDNMTDPNHGVGMQTFKKNPICHGDRAVNSPLTSITIHNVNGGEVPTSNLATPISVFIKRSTAESNLVLYPVKHDNTIGNCHCVNLTRDNQIIGIHVRDLKNDTTTSGVNFAIYLNNGSCPDPENSNYTWSSQLPRSVDDIKANLSASDAAMLSGQSGLELLNELQNTLIMPANMTNTAGLYCVFVTLSAATVKFDTATKPVEPNIVYEFGSFVDNPVYFSEASRTWRSDGVSVGPLTCRTLMHLLVTHLTSFASDFVVPPNTIDFNTVWSKFQNLSNNAAVFSTVISTLILYIILLIWGRIMDKRDIKRWGATNLHDNIPSDTYHYQISVMTGYRQGSGTTSKVYFIMCGDNGDTGIRELNDGDRKGFPRGTVYNYIMSTDSALGALTFLRIWHDSSGKGKHRSWYLDQVVVNDLQTGEKFFFLCNNWLAVEEGDGMVERILPVSGFADLVAFKQLFSSSVQRKLRNEHLWFSIFSRPTRSAFTRVQRISCCLALLFLTMITNAMFFKSADNMQKRTGISIGPITFTLDQLFVSVVSTLIVFPPSIIIITFFKKCKANAAGNKVLQVNQDLSTKSSKYTWRSINKSSELFNIAEEGQASSSSGWGGETTMDKKNNRIWENLRNMVSFQSDNKEIQVEDPEAKKNKPFLFPHWCLYVAWVLVFFSVFGSAFFVILYSMEWGRDKSNDWLLTFLLSFVQNVILVQPIKVLVLAAVISMIIKRPDLDDEEAAFDDAMLKHDEELLQKKEVDIQHIMLQRRTAREDLCMPNQEKLAEIREMRLKEIQMEGIIKEMVAYSIFVLITFFISYQTRSINSFKLGEVMRNTFTNNFDNSIQSYQDFYNYLNTTLIPNMYAGDFDDGTLATWRDKLAINDGSRNIMRVGVPRLRQFRIQNSTCKTYSAFTTVIDIPCRGAYNWVDDDTGPYEPMWDPMDPDKWESVKSNDSFSSPFVYSSSIKLKGIPYMAQVNTYKGGGYVLNFPRAQEDVQQAISDIYSQNWLDTRTRAVFIEFTVYNAPANLFASVVMVAEFLETGSAVTYSEVQVFRLFAYVGSFGIIVMFMQIVFALFVLYFGIREGLQIKRERCAYFSSFWNVLEFVTLSITIVAVVMYGFKMILANIAMDALSNAKSSDFVNFGSLSTYDSLYIYMVGIVVFISTVKFIKILRFNRRMGMLGATIKLAYKDLRSFMFMFVIYFTAFCSAAYLIFGTQLLNYRSMFQTWGALFSMSLGVFDFKSLVTVSSLLGPLFFFSFICLVTFGLLGIFLTIINESFAVVKANASLQGNDYELVEFMTKRVRQLFGCSTMGGGGSDSADEAVEAKEGDDEGEDAGGKLGDSSLNVSGSLSRLKF